MISLSCIRYCEFKMVYYSSVSYLYMGIQSEESQQMGERITYFEKASELLTNAAKLAKNLDNDVVKFLAVIQNILTKFHKTNSSLELTS